MLLFKAYLLIQSSGVHDVYYNTVQSNYDKNQIMTETTMAARINTYTIRTDCWIADFGFREVVPWFETVARLKRTVQVINSASLLFLHIRRIQRWDTIA